MYKFLIISLITWVLSSCISDSAYYDTDKAHFKVTNSTNYKIDSLFISNQKFDIARNNKTFFLNPKESKKIEIDMTDTNVDGSYSIHYEISEEEHYENFGYYTNGFPLEEIIKINIVTPDSLMIEYK